MSEDVYLDFESAELIFAWKALKAEFKDISSPCPKTGETWQYMKTFRKNNWWWHSFRHRSHPDLDDRQNFNVPATKHWVDKKI